jgi:hypothetical protein
MAIHSTFEIKDVITIAIATVGAVLGVINMWRAISRDKPKLKLIPKHAFPFGGVDERINFCIEAVNLSPFPLTVVEIGFEHVGTKTRSALVGPILLDHGTWPRVLEPRTSVSVYARGDAINIKNRIKRAYAKTACGLTFRGTSGALKQFANNPAASIGPHGGAAPPGRGLSTRS